MFIIISDTDIFIMSPSSGPSTESSTLPRVPRDLETGVFVSATEVGSIHHGQRWSSTHGDRGQRMTSVDSVIPESLPQPQEQSNALLEDYDIQESGSAGCDTSGLVAQVFLSPS